MKKFTKIISVVLICALMLTMLAGCGNNGTYYLQVNGEDSESVYITIDGDTWTSSAGDSGTCTIDGDSITLSYEVFGISVDYAKGTIDGGEITFSILGVSTVYKK